MSSSPSPSDKPQADTSSHPPKCCGKCPRGQCKYLKWLVDHKAYCKPSNKSSEDKNDGMYEIDAREYQMFLMWKSRLTPRIERMINQENQHEHNNQNTGPGCGCCSSNSGCGCCGGESQQTKEIKVKGIDTSLIPPPPSATFCACSMLNPPNENRQQRPQNPPQSAPQSPPPMPYPYYYAPPPYPYPYPYYPYNNMYYPPYPDFVQPPPQYPWRIQ